MKHENVHTKGVRCTHAYSAYVTQLYRIQPADKAVEYLMDSYKNI